MTRATESDLAMDKINSELRHALGGSVASLLDVGCGIAPQTVVPVVDRHVGLDVYMPYVDLARSKGVEVVVWDLNMVPLPFEDNSLEVVWLGDVIEHLEKPAGMALFNEAKRIASKAVVVRSPQGFEEQNGDAWGLGGDHWQEHRSGWIPEEFGPERIWRLPAGTIPGCASPWFQALVRVDHEAVH